MGLLDGLGKFGINDLGVDDIFSTKEEKKDSAENNTEPAEAKVEKPRVNEMDFLFEKTYECPVCDFSFKELTVKSSRARVIKIEKNLRPVVEDFEPIKYEVISCPMCGYTTMNRYFGPIMPRHKEAFIAEIGRSYPANKYYQPFVMGYDEAIERVELALATAIVKKAKASEKAYICLKGKWLCESCFADSVVLERMTEEEKAKMEEKHTEFHNLAFDGFIAARQSEDFPIAGMDSSTLDYLIAAMAMESGKYDVSSKMVSSLLQNVATPSRIKDKARAIKEELIVRIKEQKDGKTQG